MVLCGCRWSASPVNADLDGLSLLLHQPLLADAKAKLDTLCVPVPATKSSYVSFNKKKKNAFAPTFLTRGCASYTPR